MRRLFLVVISLFLAGCVTGGVSYNAKPALPKDKQIKIALLKYEMARNIILHKDYAHLAEAFGYLDEAQKVLKNDPRIYYIKALAYQMRGNRKLYAEYLRKAIEADKNFFDAYNALGVYYFEKGNYKKALALFTKLINNPLYAHTDIAFYNRSRVYLKLSELARAEDDLESALAFSSYGSKVYWKALIFVEMMRKEYLKALENLYKMEDYTGPSYYIDYTRALCYYKLDMPDKALEQLNRIKDDDPKYAVLKAQLLRKIERSIHNDNNTDN